MNLNHPRWEGHQFNYRKSNPVHYNNSAGETSRIRNLHKSLKESTKQQLDEWGSSDQGYFNQSIHRDLGEPERMPSPFSDELESAAESAVDFYWDDWEEYQTNRQGLIDNAKRGYLRSYFREDFDNLVKMFEPAHLKSGDDLLSEWATLSSNKGQLNMEPENHALSSDRHGLVINHLNEVNKYIDQESLHQFVEEVNKVEERLGYVKKNR
tara:strand:+ start:275 stop:904 length:630 start_codon:yes stop_codon:yes gene_type:complete